MTKLLATAATVLVLGFSVAQAAPSTGTSPVTEAATSNVAPAHFHHHHHRHGFHFHGFHHHHCHYVWTIYGYVCA